MTNTHKYLLYSLGFIASLFIPVIGLIAFDSIVIGLVVGIPISLFFLVKAIQSNIAERNLLKTRIEVQQTPSQANLISLLHLDTIITPYFSDLWNNLMEYGWIDISYQNSIVVQFVNLPDDNGNKENIVLWFYPYACDDELVDRFFNNAFMSDCEEVYKGEPEAFMQFQYGTDINKALQVATYILSTVYLIPTTAMLTYSCSTPKEKWSKLYE